MIKRRFCHLTFCLLWTLPAPAQQDRLEDPFDVSSGFDAAPAERETLEPHRGVREPTRSPVFHDGTPFDEKGFIVELATGPGRSRGRMTRAYARNHFSHTLLDGTIYRGRLMVVADRHERTANSYYFAWQRMTSAAATSYEQNSLQISAQTSSYQVGFQRWWRFSQLKSVLISAEVDIGVTVEEIMLTTHADELQQTRLRPNQGVGIALAFFPIEALYLNSTLRIDTHTEAALFIGGGYVF